MKHLYLIYHVPRTGGQTLRDHLDTHLVRDRDFFHLGRWDRDAPLSIDDVAVLTPDERDRLRSVGGHPVTRGFASMFPERKIREVVFVREPAARMVSHYNLRCTMQERTGRPTVSFEEFVAEMKPNKIARFLFRTFEIPRRRAQLSELLAELTNIWMCGTTDSMDVLAPRLFAAMGMEPLVPARSNASGATIERHLTLTPDIAEFVRAQSPLDVQLFEACRRIERRTLERLEIVPGAVARRSVGFVPR